jgi:hypothetical protein
MSNNFLSIENEGVLTRHIKPKNVAKYMYKTKVNILFKYTSSCNVLFRYDMYQRKSTKAKNHEGESKSTVTLPAGRRN